MPCMLNLSLCFSYQIELKELEPELQKKSVETEELMGKLKVDQEKANEVSAPVEAFQYSN